MSPLRSIGKRFLRYRLRSLLLLVVFAAIAFAVVARIVHRPLLALDGCCPVSLVHQKAWIKGDPKYRTVYEHQVFYFASVKAQQTFEALPSRYAPVCSGNDVVRLQDDKAVVPGRRDHGFFYEGQIYLFESEASVQKFYQNPNEYRVASCASGQPLPPRGRSLVALDGYCPVSVAEQKTWILGNPTIRAVYDHQVFHFASAEVQKIFEATPAQYAPVCSGNDVVRMQDDGAAVQGYRNYGVRFEGRLYLFENELSLAKFNAHPDRYQVIEASDADANPDRDLDEQQDLRQFDELKFDIEKKGERVGD